MNYREDYARWLASDELDSVQWLPADWEIIARLRELLQLKYECLTKCYSPVNLPTKRITPVDSSRITYTNGRLA